MKACHHTIHVPDQSAWTDISWKTGECAWLGISYYLLYTD